jgi:alpha-N-arabinofuranosidase
MRTMARTLFTVGLVALGSGGALAGAGAQDSVRPIIVLHADSPAGAVSPVLFGANFRWEATAADPDSGMTHPFTVEQIKNVGIALIRYPAGPVANLFQWQRAVGPRSRRSQQLSDPSSGPAPAASGFGPDEFGDLLDKTRAVGNLTINFSTGSAANAANFVAYMSAPIGSALVNGVDWASRRAANRHPLAYKIAYVGIGNGYEPMAQTLAEQNYWMSGKPTSVNDSCAADKISCLYAFGGSTRFEHQTAVQLADWRELSSMSSGEPRQTLYARYAPVAAGSETVSVAGTVWQGSSDLQATTADAQVYRIDYQTGAITFGDGVHGAIPPKGGKVTLSYTSGPHDGFVDYYRMIKAVAPSVKVCASIHDESFIRIMGAQHAYDCIEQQPQVMGHPQSREGNGVQDEQFVRAASQTVGLEAGVQRTQQLVRKYAGANAANVEVVLDENGEPGAFRAFAPPFARSEGAAVLSALYWREWVLAGVAAASPTSLTDSIVQTAPATRPLVQVPTTETVGDYGLFTGAGPETIVTPSALVIKLLRQNTGNALLATSIEGNPKLSSPPGESIDALQAYATRDALGNAYLVVINIDPQHDIQSDVRAEAGSFAAAAAIATLASRDLADENNPKSPQLVSIQESSASVGGGVISVSFPKHSVTAIKLSAAK